jgi:hypothetical protein
LLNTWTPFSNGVTADGLFRHSGGRTFYNPVKNQFLVNASPKKPGAETYTQERPLVHSSRRRSRDITQRIRHRVSTSYRKIFNSPLLMIAAGMSSKNISPRPPGIVRNPPLIFLMEK